MTGAKPWLAPLTGIGFVALVIVSFVIAGEPPEADDEAAEIVQFYVDDKDSIQLSAGLAVIGAVLFAFFSAMLSNVLRAGEGDGPGFAVVGLIGTAVFTAGIAIDAMIFYATAEAAEDVDPVAVQTLQAIWDNDFFPLALGVSLFNLGYGISIIKTGTLPKWLGWIAIVLGVVAVTPVGFVAAGLTAIWVIVTSILLAMRPAAVS